MQQSSNNSSSSVWIVAAILLVTQIISVFATVSILETRTLEREYAKVGGKENFELFNTANRIQFTQQIDSIRQFVNSNGANTPSAGGETTTPPAQRTLTQDQIASIKKDAYLEGSADAQILLVEYSDMECPFCIRQHNESRAIQLSREKFGDKVAHIFKNHRGVNHSGTQAKAVAALCAGKVGWVDKYAAFYNGVFAQSTTQTVSPLSTLPAIAQEIGLDTAQWQSCVDKNETLARFEAETNEGLGFGINGTPGTMVINLKTGKYSIVEGAYPFSEFESQINALLQ